MFQLKSKNARRITSKKCFIDPSIAAASLNLTPEKLLNDFESFEKLFENLCIRDINIYSYKRQGKTLQYHDQDDLDIDCVLVLNNKDYALIEFKLGSKSEDEGASNLCKVKELINKKRKSGKTKIPEPKFLAIITGGKIAYTRKDGVKVIPIGCLR